MQASGTGDPSGAWSQQFAYDGYGNLTQKAGSNAPTNSYLATNPANNQLTGNGAQYNANGNLSAYGTGSFEVSYSYDVENRMLSATPAGSTQTAFGYDQSSQRIYQGTYNTSTGAYSNEQIYFYGAEQMKLAVRALQSSGSTAGPFLKSNPLQETGSLSVIVSGQTRLNSLDRPTHLTHSYSTASG